MASKTELFDEAQKVFEGLVADDATENEIEEAWADAMAQAEDMLLGLTDNIFA